MTPNREETIARAKEMRRLHVEQKMSLQAIGNQCGLSRERVRQIIQKYETVFCRQEAMAQGQLRLIVMGDLFGIVSRRIWTVIERTQLESYPIQSFIDRIDLREIMDHPNVGKRSIRELLTIFEQAGYDVSHLWAARNWQNYNASEHRSKSFGGGDFPNLDCIPSLYEESGAGSEGAGLPAI